MSAGEERQAALVPARTSRPTKAGAKSLAARGRADLRIREQAEEWLNRGLELRDHGYFKEAFANCERGIELSPNHPEMQFFLGCLYSAGHGVEKDNVQAAAWWRKAAEQGHAWAQNNLGMRYHWGVGVPQSDSEAYYWFDLSVPRAEQLDSSEDVIRADAAIWRERKASHLTHEELSQAQARARKWFAEHPTPK